MDKRIFLLAFIIVFTIVPSTEAATIDFEGLNAVDNAYSGLGVSFNPSNQDVCAGISNGDPGGWFLEGTNKPYFLCFNGINPGYTMELTFVTPQSSISLDVSRSGGSSPGQTFTLNAYNGATLLDTKTVILGDVNSWSTVSITTPGFNRITWDSTGVDFHPYGVDNLIFVQSTPVSPEEGTIGTEISIVGSDFGAKKGKVYLGAVALKVLIWNDEIIQCLIKKPLSPSSYDVRIQPKGAAEILLPNAFSVEAPRIDSINPIQGSQGAEVTIFGDFFGIKKGKVTLGGQNCKVLDWAMDATTGESEILIEVPKGLTSGTYDLTVTNQVGSDTMDEAFTIL